jgi:hypothetical protein
VVQHKQTRELYALKYINKAKCVKMKAVANVIQERRLLEEARIVSGSHCFLLTIGFRLIIHSLSTCGTPSRTMKIVSLF